MRTKALLAIVSLCIGLLAASFHSSVRFAHPVTGQFARGEQDFHCYHDIIYGGANAHRVLYFGASRTMFAISPDIVEDAYRAVRGRDTSAFAFSTAWSNPEIMYFFFRDYLENNPAPNVAMFELVTAFAMPDPVKYVNPLYPYLAPPYLYLDVLRSWDFVESKLYALSHFLRLLIWHIDLTLTNLLVADRQFLVPGGDNCGAGILSREMESHRPPEKHFGQVDSFEALLDAETEGLLPAEGWEQAGDWKLLAEHYSGNAAVQKRLEAFGPNWSKKRPERLWYRTALKDRSLSYYQRIVELGEAHGVTVQFYVMPGVYIPEATSEQLKFLERKVGAPVNIIPYRYARVAYHHYRDLAHVQPQAVGLMSAWAASLIDSSETH